MSLYGYTGLHSNPETALTVIQVILETQTFLASDIVAETHLLLNKFAKSSRSLSAKRQDRLLKTAIRALGHSPSGVLEPLITALATKLEDRKLGNLLDAIDKRELSMQILVWWTLLPRAQTFQSRDYKSAITFLLTPIDGELALNDILELLPQSVLDMWLECEWSHEIQYLFEGIPSSSRKRRRSSPSFDSFLADHLPDVKFESGADPVRALLSASGDEAVRAKIMTQMGLLFCAMAGCSKHRLPLAPTLSRGCVDLWLRGADGSLESLQALTRMMDHMSERDVAVGIQIRDGAKTTKILLHALRSEIRPVRLAAG